MLYIFIFLCCLIIVYINKNEKFENLLDITGYNDDLKSINFEDGEALGI